MQIFHLPQPSKQDLPSVTSYARQPLLQFGSTFAPNFKYNRYANLMFDVAVGGVKPGELALIHLVHQELSDATLDKFVQLVKRGYSINLAAYPKKTARILQKSAGFRKLDTSLNRRYDHVLKFRDNEPSPAAEKTFRQLSARDARPNETVRMVVLTDDPDMLAHKIAARIVKAGGTPEIRGYLPNVHLSKLLLNNAVRDEQIKFIPPELELIGNMQKCFQIINTPAQAVATKFAFADTPEVKAHRKLYGEAVATIYKTFMDRMRRIEWQDNPGDGFFRSLGDSPAEGPAEQCGMSVPEFAEFYNKITELNRPDPVTYYRELDRVTRHIANQFEKFDTLHVTRDDGKTDLTVSYQGRRFSPSAFTGNALFGEVFTSPEETKTTGKIYCDIPFFLDKKEFQGVTFHLKDGRVYDLSVEKGDENYLKNLVIQGGSHYEKNFDILGEFAVGMNRKITKLLGGKAVAETLIAEKQDVHIALGESYVFCNGTNKCNRHVDISTRSGPGSGLKIEAKRVGKSEYLPVYANGVFTPEFLSYQANSSWQKVVFPQEETIQKPSGKRLQKTR